MELAVKNKGMILASKSGTDEVYLVYPPRYKKGDTIVLSSLEPGFYEVRLEDTMLPAEIYVPGTHAEFPIPFGVYRAGYAPRSFEGERHLITARKSKKSPGEKKNLALNPYDTAFGTGMFPHISTNVCYPDSFRNKIFPDIGLFAARNVIDGIFANESHRLYPYQSWGINRNSDAWLKLEFGRPVHIDEIILTIRCEFPHDNYWIKGTFLFSDGSSLSVPMEKTAKGQVFSINISNITSIILKDLIISNEPSPFPGLTQLEVWGTDAEEKG